MISSKMATVGQTVWLCLLLQLGPLFCEALDAEFNKQYHGTVSAGNQTEYTFQHDMSAKEAVRIHFMSPDSVPVFPILLVVKRPRSVLSWTVPYAAANNDLYDYVSHTLCPDSYRPNGTVGIETITVVISTSSSVAVNYTLIASLVENYNLQLNSSVTFKSDPATPQYYQYHFPEGVDMVLVKAISENKTCAYLSVQSAECPVYDDVSTLRYNDGSFQTMTTKAAITVERNMFKTGSFLIVLVVHPDDHMCEEDYKSLMPLATHTVRTKIVTVSVEKTLETSGYWRPIVTTFGVVAIIYLLTALILTGDYMRLRKNGDLLGRPQETDVEQEERQGEVPFLQQPQGAASSNYGTAERHASPSKRLLNKPLDEISKISIEDEDDIDMLDDIESTKEVYRTKMDLCVSDLSRKKPCSLEKKYNMYAWNLFTVSVFYALPVVQLVITYQVVTNVTGNQDSCYYNFLCAKPYGWFSAFNNVFSNTGYIMLGLLFLLLVWRRDRIHQRRAKAGHKSEVTHGIPKHYGLHYALGYALVMEGIMSGCYHVCPNRANYQFDTAYMYMIACLGMLKVYQQRHPDINANSYTSFALFALILFIGFLGLIFSSIYFYILFFFLHMITCLGLSAQIYYMGTVKLDMGIFKRTLIICKSDIFTRARPSHPARLALLTVGCVVNLALSILGLVTRPLDFASFLLAIMIVNMLLYLSFYFLMKLISREKILFVVIVFTILTLFVWGAALYFFKLNETAWQYSAAVSREYNGSCVIMGFFGPHDIWHFLSAFALFISFVLVLLLDDDLDDQPRNKIRVF